MKTERYRKMSGVPWLAVTAATLLLSALLTLISDDFLTTANFQSVLIQASVTAIMAAGMTYVIIVGGIDISVGAILFFVSSLFAQTIHSTGSYTLAFTLALLCGAALGLINGVLVVIFNVTPLITTLATYTIYRGMAIHFTGAQNIPVPREIGFLGNGELLGIPVPILLMLLTAGVGVYLLNHTRFGLYARAIGNSRQSAAESGLPIRRVTITTYVLASLTSTLAALILIARVGGLQSGIGIGLEFTVIAAVILGGTKLSGGSGTVTGSVIGAIFLVLIDNGLNMLNASPYIYDTVRGAVLLAAVVIDRLSVMRHSRHIEKQNALRIQRTVT